MFSRPILTTAGSALLAMTISGCMLLPDKPEITGQRVQISPLGECLHVSNGTIELVVSPQTGRIIGFGWADERNLLWLNPRAGRYLSTTDGWYNWGGETVWIWPRNDWQRVTGQSWPPPTETDGLPYTCRIRKKGRLLRNVSQPISEYGLKVVKDIRIRAKEPAIEVTTRLQKAGPGPASAPWTAAWMRTLIPLEVDVVYARLSFADSETVLHPVSDDVRFAKPRRYGSVLVIDAARGVPRKAGLDADLLAVKFGNTLLVQQRAPFGKNALLRPGERAQVYSSLPESDTFGTPPGGYFALEFTGPLADRSDLDETELKVTWSLIRLQPGIREEGIARILENL